MSLLAKAIVQLSRLHINATQQCARAISTQGGPLFFQASTVLNAAPMKKKKRVDVSLLVTKENKKKRKLEKTIRRLEMKGRILKPVEEIEGERDFVKTVKSRQRKAPALSFEESEQRALLLKDWSRSSWKKHVTEMQSINRLYLSQQRALTELRMESEELYQMAIQTDDNLFPTVIQGPVATPPIKDYEAPDGDYVDTTPVLDKY